MLPIFPDCLGPPASSLEGPLLARGPSQSHCSELFMVSSGTRSRLSGDFFIYHVRRLSSSPFSSSPVHLWRMLSALGGPFLPALLLASVEPLPRWRQAPPPLQRWMDRAACRIHSKTAQHGTARTSFPGIETGIEVWRDSEGAPGKGLSISTVVLFFLHRAGRGSAPTVLRVYVCAFVSRFGSRWCKVRRSYRQRVQ